MSFSMSQASLPAVEMTLNALSGVLDKGAAFAAAKKIDPSVLLTSRLAPDMFGLMKQAQAMQAKMQEMQAEMERIEVEGQAGGGMVRVTLTAKGQMKGDDFLNHFVLPNVYFHCTAAYAILRHCGVELGKSDFLGGIPLKMI